MQEREGKPVTPGQWMEQNTEVFTPGLMIFLAVLAGAGARGAAWPPRGVMEMEEGWDWPGTGITPHGPGIISLSSSLSSSLSLSPLSGTAASAARA